MEFSNYSCSKQISSVDDFFKSYLCPQRAFYFFLSKKIFSTSKNQNCYDQIRFYSYFTLIIPTLVLLVLIVIKLILLFYKLIFFIFKKILCVTGPAKFFGQPIREKLVLTKEQKETLINSLKKEAVNQLKEISESELNKTEGDIEWLSTNGLFRHRGIPGLIFKIPIYRNVLRQSKKDQVISMLNFSNKCWKICKDNNLDLLEIPNVGIESLGIIYGEERSVLLIEQLDLDLDFENQFIKRRKASKDPQEKLLLEKLEKQIVKFVFYSEYKNARYKSIPILNRKLAGQPLRAAIIEFDQYDSDFINNFLGSEKIYKYKKGESLFFMLETKEGLEKAFKKAFFLEKLRTSFKNRKNLKNLAELSKELLNFQNKQEKFHLEKNIITGREVLSLGPIVKTEKFEETEEYKNLLLDFNSCSNPILAYKMLIMILKDLNKKISQSTFKEKVLIRQQNLFMTEDYLVGISEGPFEKKGKYKDENELFSNSLLHQVCKILVNRKVISSFKFENPLLSFWF